MSIKIQSLPSFKVKLERHACKKQVYKITLIFIVVRLLYKKNQELVVLVQLLPLVTSSGVTIMVLRTVLAA